MTEDIWERLIEYDAQLGVEIDSPSNDGLNQASYKKQQKDLREEFPEITPVHEYGNLSSLSMQYLESAGIERIYDLTQLTVQEFREKSDHKLAHIDPRFLGNIRNTLLNPHNLDFKQE